MALSVAGSRQGAGVAAVDESLEHRRKVELSGPGLPPLVVRHMHMNDVLSVGAERGGNGVLLYVLSRRLGVSGVALVRRSRARGRPSNREETVSPCASRRSRAAPTSRHGIAANSIAGLPAAATRSIASPVVAAPMGGHCSTG